MKFLLVLFLFSKLSYAEQFIMPATCDTLLPEMEDYVNFLDNVANYWVSSSKATPEKIYQLLSIRTQYQRENTFDMQNPVDDLIKSELCDCLITNNNEIFTATAPVVKNFLTKNITRIIKSAEEEYVNLKMKLYTINNAERKKNLNKKEIASIKSRAEAISQNRLRYLSRKYQQN
jgi:hypothetical protein